MSLKLVGADMTGVWDSDRLFQVFSNLVANAVQHGMPARGVTVHLDGSAADRIIVQVGNAGSSPETLLPTLFEPMAGRAHRHGKSRGLGLGLYISREIVRAHGGRISVSSNEEDGTIFTVTLPRGAANGHAVSRSYPSRDPD